TIKLLLKTGEIVEWRSSRSPNPEARHAYEQLAQEFEVTEKDGRFYVRLKGKENRQMELFPPPEGEKGTKKVEHRTGEFYVDFLRDKALAQVAENDAEGRTRIQKAFNTIAEQPSLGKLVENRHFKRREAVLFMNTIRAVAVLIWLA